MLILFPISTSICLWLLVQCVWVSEAKHFVCNYVLYWCCVALFAGLVRDASNGVITNCKRSSSRKAYLDLCVCLCVCLHLWNSSFKCSLVIQSTDWDKLTNLKTVLHQLCQQFITDPARVMYSHCPLLFISDNIIEWNVISYLFQISL